MINGSNFSVQSGGLARALSCIHWQLAFKQDTELEKAANQENDVIDKEHNLNHQEYKLC